MLWRLFVPNGCLPFPTRERPMPPLDPDVLDLAPSDPALTGYDEQHEWQNILGQRFLRSRAS